jgi:preprotein translocase subunit SecA
MSIWKKIFGDPNARIIKGLEPLVFRINELEPGYKKLSDADLKLKTLDFKERLKKGETLDDILPDAFAACREAASRTLHQRHFDVQLLGGIVLHRGQIAEMRTGEGKTLTATLAVYLNALDGKGTHVVTVNDYLSRRDATWMGQIYYALGLSVSCINHLTAYVYDPAYTKNDKEKNAEGGEKDKERDTLGTFKVEYSYLRPVSRREAYEADITYGTNNEFGFDYLRDNMANSPEQKVQRPLNFAIVDEVDSILIDEARTPLIISAPAEESTDLYYKFADLVKRLKEGEDYNVDLKMRAATLSEAGITKMEKFLGVANIYEAGGVKMAHHIDQALKARALFERDRDYVVKDGEVIIVDEFTGRLMFGRRYSEGLHQAIEAKEGVKIQRESETLATVTFQNYFRLYKKLAGMTGTAATEAEEFSKIYNLEVVEIPTNKLMVRADFADRIYRSEHGKWQAVVREVKERHEKGQPVLVGTISIEKNEALSLMLEREGVPHKLLNAKNHEREAEIIAQAGRLGAVTIATNMAGRGVDIILGGNPPSLEEAKKVRALGGLHVLGTERHESRRIDNQLRGRAGRQGDQGSSQFYVSMEDDLMKIFGSNIKGMMERLGLPEDMPIENSLVSRSLESAQKKVEGHNFDIRKHLLEYDDVLNKHREVIYKKRDEILGIAEKGSLREEIMELVEQEIEQIVLFHTSNPNESEWNIEEIYESVDTIFPISTDARIKIDDLRHHAGDKLQDIAVRTQIIEYLSGLAAKAFDEFERRVENAAPEGLDARRFIAEVQKNIMLHAVDTLWIEHLEAMDHLKTGIGLRGYGQRDPLVEYKREAFRLFQELTAYINKQIVYNIFKVGVSTEPKRSLMNRRGIQLNAPPKEGDFRPAPAKSAEEKVGRNDPCPCGSGKKYKRCHGNI